MRARRRRTAAAIVALCLATAVPLSLSFADFSAGDVLEAAVAKAQSLADLLDRRSPGERTQAQLTKTRQHALARHRVGPGHTAPPEAPLATLLMGPPEPLPVELAAAPLLTAAPPTLGTIIGSPGGGSLVGPPGGSVVGPPGGDTPATIPNDSREPVVEVPSAVPEPATWAMMLLGFGLIGWRTRHGPRAKLAAAYSQHL
jgi:hypothetical protein